MKSDDPNRYLFDVVDRRPLKVTQAFEYASDVTVYSGDCMDLLRSLPTGAARLIVTSPPYNIGKEYEKRTALDEYLSVQRAVITESVRLLAANGSICWQVGNYVDRGRIIPLDTLLYPIFDGLGLILRNRIVWHFEHGLHCTNRLSGRYEVILWFTKSDDYVFHLDDIRVPQKYPGKKHFKGPNAGQYSGNPKGKNPGDVWNIPNVKSNHVEKTDHPCQFPVELIERLVLALTDEGDLVIDPFLGVGTTAVAAYRHRRKAAGADINQQYLDIATERLRLESLGELRTRPMGKPVHEPTGRETVVQNPFN